MIAAILKRTKTVLTALLLLLATTQVWALSYDSEALVVLGNKESTFDEKQEAIKALAKSQESYAVAVLKALMNSGLFYEKKAGTLYIETQNGSFISVLSNERYQGKKRNLKKVAINNSIREQLSLIISIADLSNHQASMDERINEAYNLIGKVSFENTEPFMVLRDKAYGVNDEFATALNYVIATADLQSPDAKIRNGAMRILEDFKSPVLIDKFEKIATSDEDLSNRAYAIKQVASLKSSQKFYSGVETLYFGLSLG